MTQNDPRWWNLSAFVRRKPYLAARAAIAASLRAYFAAEDFVEVETPALQISPGMEPHLKAFATTLESPLGGRREIYLHTSPEFAMKKLLVAGVPRLFQFARCFRNGERSDLHHPEFTMLEWYRADAGYFDLMIDCVNLVRSAARAAHVHAFRRGDTICDPFADFERLTVAEAFSRHAGIDLAPCLGAPGDLEPDPELLKREAARIGVRCESRDRFEDVFFRILLARIEPELGKGKPTILYDYPICMAALARAKPADLRFAERMELYLCGVEIANGFGELTIAAEQRRRFLHDCEVKERLYGIRYPVDVDFLAAMEHGMPPSAGIALGFDRLVMVATGAERIEDVLWAPVEDALEGASSDESD